MGQGLSFDRKVLLAVAESSFNVDAIAPLLSAGANEVQYLALNRGASLAATKTKFQPDLASPCPSGRKFSQIPTGSAISMSGPFRGWRDGAAGSNGNELPYYDAILQGAGFTPAIVTPGAEAEYVMGCDTGASFTAYCWRASLDETEYEFQYQTGITGNITITAAAETEIQYAFEGRGVSANEPSVKLVTGVNDAFDGAGAPALYPDGTFDANRRPTMVTVAPGTPTAICADTPEFKAVSLDVEFGSVGGGNVDPPIRIPVSSYEFATNWDINETRVINATGQTSTCCTFRDRTSNATAVVQLEDCDDGSAYDEMLTQWLSAGIDELKLIAYGGDKNTSGTPRLTITIPMAQVDTGTLVDNAGAAAYTIPFEVVNDCVLPGATLREVVITYDAVP